MPHGNTHDPDLSEPRPLARFFTAREAAAFSGYTEKALESMRSRGIGPAFTRPTQRSIRYNSKDLERWLAGGHSEICPECGAALNSRQQEVAAKS